jgi:hypothetical protein
MDREKVEPEEILTPIEICKRLMHLYSKIPMELIDGRLHLDVGGTSEDLSLAVLYRKAVKTIDKYGENGLQVKCHICDVVGNKNDFHWWVPDDEYYCNDHLRDFRKRCLDSTPEKLEDNHRKNKGKI